MVKTLNQRQKFFETMGGSEALRKLTDAFFDRVAEHPELIPIFPEDLTESREKEYRFFVQFFGGPPLYTEQYGHPRLYARHLPFEITPERARAWMDCIIEAMDEVGFPEPIYNEMIRRLTATAYNLVNTASTKGGKQQMGSWSGNESNEETDQRLAFPIAFRMPGANEVTPTTESNSDPTTKEAD